MQNAKDNMVMELGNKPFDQIRKAAKESWEEVLNTIRVETSDTELKRSFYTRIYHACQTRSI